MLFKKTRLEYFGDIISKDGIQPSKERQKAFQELPTHTNLGELRRIISMVRYLGKFLTKVSERIQPMTDLLKKALFLSGITKKRILL